MGGSGAAGGAGLLKRERGSLGAAWPPITEGAVTCLEVEHLTGDGAEEPV
ncbi:hypothetical protein FHR84_000215 [Actinopolyspora biskrensis]|uniref:Uncharacterized protein n=1 Tax=Actinopolyspora biskrensis TaxID=1470178 RepID=A0A852YQ84_9ACTN|nr:hypothetical protein [Actinopolyspora biskrensis]NYH76901.1 hypothetical protein [Actinopolyspora biskrensis]